MSSVLTKLTIPPEWTGEQVLAVVEFLDEISTAIWEVHDQKILDAMNKREREESVPDEEDGRPLKPEDDLYYNKTKSPFSDDDYPF
jgi:hypothetical protein